MYGVILKLQNLSEAVKFSALMELSCIQRPNMVFAISRLQSYSLTTPVCTSRCTTISTTEPVHRRIIQYMMHEVTECWSFKLDIAWESIPKIKRQTRKWRNVSCFVQSATTRDFFRIWNMDVGWASCTPHKDWFFWQCILKHVVHKSLSNRMWPYASFSGFDDLLLSTHMIIISYSVILLPVSLYHVHMFTLVVLVLRTVIHAIVKCGGYQHQFRWPLLKESATISPKDYILVCFLKTVFGIHQIKTKPPMCSSSTAALPAKIRYLQLFGNVKTFLGCCFTGQFTSPQLVEPHLRFTYFQGDI